MKILLQFLNWINPDRIRYYKHPDEKFVWLLLPGKLASEKTFRENYPFAIEITRIPFNRLVFKKGVKMVIYADQDTFNQHSDKINETL